MNWKLRCILIFIAFTAAVSTPVYAASDSEPLPLPAMSFGEMRLNFFADGLRTNRVFLVFTAGASDRVRIELLKECTLKFTPSSPSRKLHMEVREGVMKQTVTGGLRATVEIGGEPWIEVTADQVTLERTPREHTR